MYGKAEELQEEVDASLSKLLSAKPSCRYTHALHHHAWTLIKHCMHNMAGFWLCNRFPSEVEAFAEAVDATVLKAVERMLGVSSYPYTNRTDTNPWQRILLGQLDAPSGMWTVAIPTARTVMTPNDVLREIAVGALFNPGVNVATGNHDPRSLKPTLLEFNTMRYGVKYIAVPWATAVDRALFETSCLDMSEYTDMVFGTMGEVTKGAPLSAKPRVNRCRSLGVLLLVRTRKRQSLTAREGEGQGADAAAMAGPTTPAGRFSAESENTVGDDYAGRLAEKVKTQAAELRQQAEDLEELAHYKELCEKRLRAMKPDIELPLQSDASKSGGRRAALGVLRPHNQACQQCAVHMAAINKVEQRAVAAEEKAANLHRSNLELRTLLEKRNKAALPPLPPSLAQLKLGKLSDNMKAYEHAKRSAEEYSQQLEAKLLGSDKGQAMVKSAKALKRLKKSDQVNSAMAAITSAQESEIEGLQKGVLELRHALHTEAKRLGLSGADALLELAQMREAVAEGRVREQRVNEELAELRRTLVEAESREEGLKMQQAEWEQRNPQFAKLEADVERLETDNAALLEYIQELTDERSSKDRGGGRAQSLK
eukprot:jgi/Tetstr1/432895/TSEL_002337.t1